MLPTTPGRREYSARPSTRRGRSGRRPGALNRGLEAAGGPAAHERGKLVAVVQDRAEGDRGRNPIARQAASNRHGRPTRRARAISVSWRNTRRARESRSGVVRPQASSSAPTRSGAKTAARSNHPAGPSGAESSTRPAQLGHQQRGARSLETRRPRGGAQSPGTGGPLIDDVTAERAVRAGPRHPRAGGPSERPCGRGSGACRPHGRSGHTT